MLDAEVKFEDFPFLLRNEKTDFIECVRARTRDAGRRRSGPSVQHRGAIGLHRLPVGEETDLGSGEGRSSRRRRGQQLVRGQPGLPPWSIT